MYTTCVFQGCIILSSIFWFVYKICFLSIKKKEGADDFKDFKDVRPISLVGSIYKLIAEVLPNILKKVMSRVVNKAHNAFVEGRQILDASLIANELIDAMVRRKERGIAN